MAYKPTRIDIDKPLWDQSSFLGRLKHFIFITDPRTVITSTAKLYEAKHLLQLYRTGEEPSGTTERDVIYAKKLCDSSFHPDTGELQTVFGRMSFQVPGGMAITGVMLTFYKSNFAVVFWQWVNQSFNAFANYTNRNAESDITTTKIGIAYVSATTCALITALGLKARLSHAASPLLQRFVPFAAVASANMINIPLMRQSEIVAGIPMNTADDTKAGTSKYAAVKGISQVVLSRTFMAFCTMCSIPFIMNHAEKYSLMRRMTSLHAPIQVFLCGAILLVSVPVGCAFFPQTCFIPTKRLSILDKDQLKMIQEKFGSSVPDRLYFNKGL